MFQHYPMPSSVYERSSQQVVMGTDKQMLITISINIKGVSRGKEQGGSVTHSGQTWFDSFLKCITSSFFLFVHLPFKISGSFNCWVMPPWKLLDYTLFCALLFRNFYILVPCISVCIYFQKTPEKNSRLPDDGWRLYGRKELWDFTNDEKMHLFLYQK